MTKYAHVSMFKPNEFALGGVQVFQEHLQRAIPDLTLISWSDYSGHLDCKELKDFDKAAVLNEWLLGQKIIDEETVVICDGYWSLGLSGKVARLISVVHGSYFGRFLNAQTHPWGEFVGIDHIEAQFETWKDPNVETVCVSEESMRELVIAGIDTSRATVIHNGVDLDVYLPYKMQPNRVLMHAATSNRKGLDIISAIMTIEPGIQIQPMNVRSGKAEDKAARLNEAKCLIAPSRHEGNAYLLLEALACGVPLIAYETGLVPEMDARCGLFTDDIAPNNFVRMIGGFDERNHSPREWAEDNCDVKRFIKEWRAYLG